MALATFLTLVLADDVLNLRRLEGHTPTPRSEPALGVHRLYPHVECIAFGAVLLAVLTLDLQHQDLAIGEPNNEIRHIAPACAVPQVIDIETKMVVLGVGQ